MPRMYPRIITTATTGSVTTIPWVWRHYDSAATTNTLVDWVYVPTRAASWNVYNPPVWIADQRVIEISQAAMPWIEAGGVPEVPVPPPPEAVEMEARIAREVRELEARQRTSTGRARSLLRSVLSPEQRAEYDAQGRFHVTAPSGRRYKITEAWAGNVYLMVDNMPVRKFCIHPARSVPTPDSMITQKFMLETDEREFLRIANHSQLINGEWLVCARDQGLHALLEIPAIRSEAA